MLLINKVKTNPLFFIEQFSNKKKRQNDWYCKNMDNSKQKKEQDFLEVSADKIGCLKHEVNIAY